MLPWKKRGFLHWLLFQEPSRKKAARPRRRALPQHPPKFVEAEAHFDENATVLENQPETVEAYPMPDETVIEAKIADFVESDFMPEFTGHVQDEEPDEPMPEQDVPEHEELTVTPEEYVNDMNISPEEYVNGMDISPEEYVNSMEIAPEASTADIDALPDTQLEDELPETPQHSDDVQLEPIVPDEPVELPIEPDGESIPPIPDDYENEPDEEAPQLPTCENCNSMYESTDNFCGVCGIRLSRPQVSQVSAFCGNCGAKNEHMTNFCGDCGHRLVIG